jgi:hypothetical protein
VCSQSFAAPFSSIAFACRDNATPARANASAVSLCCRPACPPAWPCPVICGISLCFAGNIAQNKKSKYPLHAPNVMLALFCFQAGIARPIRAEGGEDEDV